MTKLGWQSWQLWLAVVALGGIGTMSAATSRAQEPVTQPTTTEPDRHRPGEPGRGPRHPDWDRGPEERGHGRGPGPGPREGRPLPPWRLPIFEPTEADRGPIQPGEEEELRKFAEEHMPRLGGLLRHLEQQNPSSVRKGFPELVPRLRQLRRIYTENPELGRLVEEHAASLFRVKMLRRAWIKADAGQREPIEQEMRTCLAEAVQIESRTLDCWATALESGRQEKVASRLKRLVAGEDDLTDEAQDVRTLVESLRTAPDEAARSGLEPKLKEILGRQLDHQIAAIRKRAEQLRTDAATEVDRRLERLRQPPGPRGPRP